MKFLKKHQKEALKYIVLAYLVVGILICARMYMHTSPNKLMRLIHRKLNPIVRLVDHNSGLTFCSGTVISDKIIVTAGHCVVEMTAFGSYGLKADLIDIRTNENYNINVTAKAVYATPQLDHGLLVGNFVMFDHQPYLSNIQEILSTRKDNLPYTSCGYPLFGELHCTLWYYKGLNDFMWKGSGVLLPGMSGGPVMTKDGVVIGINSQVTDELSIITPIYNIDYAIDYFGK